MPESTPKPDKPADDRLTLAEVLSPRGFLGAVAVSVVSGLLIQAIVTRLRGADGRY